MFGYIMPLKAELKIREYNLFKSYYCGVCLSIKKRFGNIPRLSLNYDMTFLALVLDGLSDDKPNIKPLRCIAHPHTKKPVILNNLALNYAADMNVSLFYYKMLDDFNDDKSLKSKFALLSLRPYKNKFTKSILFINKKIEEDLKELSRLESTKDFRSIDEISHPFSNIVGNIFKFYPNKLKNDSFDLRENLYDFGYSIGKWIYLIDALDDLEKDIKDKKFNPLNFLSNKENSNYIELSRKIAKKLDFTIINCLCRAQDLCKVLPFYKNCDIITNVITLGMMNTYKSITNLKRNGGIEMKYNYEVLNVAENATLEEINTSYNELVSKYDLSNFDTDELKNLAKEKLVEINTAYENLTK